MDRKQPATGGRLPLYELVYLIYFAVMFGARAIGLYEGTTLYNVTLVAGVLLFGAKVLMTQHSLFEYLWMGALLLLSFVVYYCSGEKGILLYFTMMLGIRGVSRDRTLRLGLTILGIGFPVLTLLTQLGLIDELSRMNERSGIGFMLRHALGYPYPNTMHTTYLILVILILYLYEARDLGSLIRLELLLMAGNCYLYFMAFSNTGFITVTFYLLLHLFFMWRGKPGRVLGVLIELVFPLTVAFSVLGPMLIGGDAFRFMDRLLHNRYRYARYFLENESVTPFGSYFHQTPNNWYMIDNAFLYLFLQLGVVTFIVVCAIQLYMIHMMVRGGRMKELAIIITFCLIGMSDPFLYNLGYKNITFIFAGECLFLLSDKLCEKGVPAILRRKLCMIPAGQREIAMPGKLSRTMKDLDIRISAHLKTHVKRYLIIFAVAALLGGGAYALLRTPPTVLYVDEWTNDPYNKKTEKLYLTEAEQTALAERGEAIFEDYLGPEEPLHAYEGTAPRFEYMRGIVTCALMVGCAAVLGGLTGSLRARRARG